MNNFDQNHNWDQDDAFFLDANTPLINERTFPRTLSRLPLTNSRIWPCNPPAPPSAPVWDRPEGEGGYLLQLLSAREAATTSVYRGLRPWESPELMPETIISSAGLDVKLLQPGTEHLQASYILSFTKQIANETCYHCVGCQLLCPCLTALQAHLMSSWELHGGCSIIYEALGMKKPTEALVQKPSTAPRPPVWLSYFSMISHGFSNTNKGDGKEKECLPRQRGRDDHRSTTVQSPLGPTKFWRGEERQSGPASKRAREEFRSPSPQPGPSRKIARSSLQDLSTLCKTTKRLREEEEEEVETEETVISRKRSRKTKYQMPDC